MKTHSGYTEVFLNLARKGVDLLAAVALISFFLLVATAVPGGLTRILKKKPARAARTFGSHLSPCLEEG